MAERGAIARLSDEECRALDVLLAAGGIGATPASIPRDQWGAETPMPAAPRHPRLRARLPALEATAIEVGGARWYGSLDELLAIASAPPPRTGPS